jgi:hypothetical protein
MFLNSLDGSSIDENTIELIRTVSQMSFPIADHIRMNCSGTGRDSSAK